MTRLIIWFLAVVTIWLGPTDHARANNDHANEILLIFNHGSSGSRGLDCYFPSFRRPKWLRNIDGQSVLGMKIKVQTPCTGFESGTFPTPKGCGDVWVCNRANKILRRIEKAIKKGYHPRHIFVGGHSAGGWSSLLIKRWNPGLFNGVIATAPAFGGQRRQRLCTEEDCGFKPNWNKARRDLARTRSWSSRMRLQHDRYLGLGAAKKPTLNALVVAFQCDPFGQVREYPFAGNKTVSLMTYPSELPEVTTCAKGRPGFRHFTSSDDPELTRCEPPTGRVRGTQLVCGSGKRRTRAHGHILNCPPELEDLCLRNQHTGHSRTAAFAANGLSTATVLEFLTQRIRKWRPSYQRPKYDQPCGFIKFSAACSMP